MQDLTRWFLRRAAPARGRLRLFCFPYAGAGPAVFRDWHRHLPEEVEVLGVRLPGRESRLGEEPFRRMEPAVEALATVVGPLLDRPYAFYGHSMGGRVGFELALRLRRAGYPEPAAMVVGASRAPDEVEPLPPLSELPDDEILVEVERRFGVANEALSNPGLAALILPALRADCELFDNYAYRDGMRLDCRLVGVSGAADPHVDLKAVSAWRRFTRGEFEAVEIPGGHFFVETERETVVGLVRAEVERALHRDGSIGSP